MSEFNYPNNNNDDGFYHYAYVTPNQVKPKREKKKYGAWVIILCCILSAAIGATTAGTCFLLSNAQQNNANLEAPILQNNKVNISVDEQSTSIVEAVATKVTPSVVGIRTTTSVVSFFGNQEDSGEGSGVIYKSNGYIITNYHVIAEAIKNSKNTKIEVFLDSADKASHQASVVGYNISADLAVIKIDAKNLPQIEIGDSKKLKTGQYVITVGNPGGLEFMDSVTYGVISGLDRVVSSDSSVSLIQTDAAINPGNSGGALVNINGELVGINSAKIVAEEFEGMGFAVPSNTVVEICDKIIENENSPEPYTGITISEKYTAGALALYGYPAGAVVLSVAEGSPAYFAGIRKGDIITSFNSKKITEYTKYEGYLAECNPNQKVPVEIYRNGKTYSTTIVIASNNLVD
ncbi:MAG: trypsin-like peptidase domain-containing protein [Clostridia bacterium]|nr:trypsin-like peptidase domain-containing protein [Clostridia bacterium]